ncbi:hypothetical protein FB381_2972 [Nocardioides albertanoniae]|uniref:Uncharacterized protein n=1 Tax=Nocardioides albertanoniae TaxID=1175486 RepID=A0A543A8Z7_9ACTN|nr:hypothetical protein [Nocardioides albertanoniae]TQL69071.1 hypothetical protein FB381_2972 [Nocardioides albertanoniae]
MADPDAVKLRELRRRKRDDLGLALQLGVKAALSEKDGEKLGVTVAKPDGPLSLPDELTVLNAFVGGPLLKAKAWEERLRQLRSDPAGRAGYDGADALVRRIGHPVSGLSEDALDGLRDVAYGLEADRGRGPGYYVGYGALFEALRAIPIEFWKDSRTARNRYRGGLLAGVATAYANVRRQPLVTREYVQLKQGKARVDVPLLGKREGSHSSLLDGVKESSLRAAEAVSRAGLRVVGAKSEVEEWNGIVQRVGQVVGSAEMLDVHIVVQNAEETLEQLNSQLEDAVGDIRTWVENL